MSNFHSIRRWLSKPSVPKSTCPPRTRLRCEAIEDRIVPTIFIPPYPLTEMAQISEMYPRHEGPTDLYLNFDGRSDRIVSPFEPTTNSPGREIQEIIFRVSEMLAPFDVRVQRISGNGNFSESGGDTTIFIGDKLSNTRYYESNEGWSIVNDNHGYTPKYDRPTLGGGLKVPNSNDYDIAYVDPISYEAQSGVNDGQPYNMASWSVNRMVRTIVHEAGHSFGLTHVLSGETEESMSYSAKNTTILNVSYPVTSQNNTGPVTIPVPAGLPIWVYHKNNAPLQVNFLSTQNSYRTLMANLGERAIDNNNVARVNSVDPGYQFGYQNSLNWNGGTIDAAVNRNGDYDVYTLTSPSSRYLQVDVSALDNDLNPILFVTDSTGEIIWSYDDNSGAGTDSRVVFHARGGKTYKIVVGAWSGMSTGEYRVEVNKFNAQVNVDLLPGFDLDLTTELPPGFFNSVFILTGHDFLNGGDQIEIDSISWPSRIAESNGFGGFILLLKQKLESANNDRELKDDQFGENLRLLQSGWVDDEERDIFLPVRDLTSPDLLDGLDFVWVGDRGGRG